MSFIFCFLSGIAFSFFLLLAWSLCRASAQADELAERITRREDGPC